MVDDINPSPTGQVGVVDPTITPLDEVKRSKKRYNKRHV